MILSTKIILTLLGIYVPLDFFFFAVFADFSFSVEASMHVIPVSVERSCYTDEDILFRFVGILTLIACIVIGL